jgi:hypothetical protein
MTNLLPNPYGRKKLDLSSVNIPTANKEWFAKDIISKNHSGAHWDRTYNLPKCCSSTWARNYLKRGFIGENGRPTLFADKEKKSLMTMLNETVYDTRSKDFQEKAIELSIQRQRQVLHKSSNEITIPSITTMKRLDEDLGLDDRKAEKTTLARARAISDIRNLASFIAANHCMIPKTNVNLIINADATQCKTSGESTKKIKVKVAKGRNTSIDPLKVLPAENESLTAFFIKYYMIFGAGGSLAMPIFILADDKMTSDDVDVHTIHGLGIGIDPNPVGYLVFCKSRTLCHAFYKWLVKDVLVPFVNKIKIDKQLDQDAQVFFTLDGESKQIVPMMDAATQSLFKNNKIAVIKPPGSTSHITQPADVGKVFKAIKTTLVGLHNKDNCNHDLEKEIEAAIDNHERKVKNKMKPAQRKKALNGLQSIHRAMNKVINPDIIRESFSETGMYNSITRSYDIEKIISKHKVVMTAEEEQNMIASIPKLSKLMSRNGELTERDLSRVGLPETTIKDNKTLIQRRSVFLTHPSVFDKEISRIEPKDTTMNKKRKLSTQKEVVSTKSAKKRKIKKDISDTEDDSDESDEDFEP